jgi:hypothetical protein
MNHVKKVQHRDREMRLRISPNPIPPRLTFQMVIRMRPARSFAKRSKRRAGVSPDLDKFKVEMRKNAEEPSGQIRPAAKRIHPAIPKRTVILSEICRWRISDMELILSCRIPHAAAAAFRKIGAFRFFNNRYMAFQGSVIKGRIVIGPGRGGIDRSGIVFGKSAAGLIA